MLKRIFALMLCVLMLVPALASCADSGDDSDLGAYITMYLTDEIYDFDPINAYSNSSTYNIVSMMYDTLFTLTKDGEIKKSLVKEYKKIEGSDENEYGVEFTLNDTYWSDGSPLTADDIIFAWKRLLNVNSNYEAASLLFDIKNARAVKQGDASIDDLGLEALESKVLKVVFEGPVDYDQFFLNLTSVVTAPLSESAVSKDSDWAKKSATIRTSGPYKLGKTTYTNTTDSDTPDTFDKYAYDAKGNLVPPTSDSNNAFEKTLTNFILERNRYYYRNDATDAIKSSVTNYRILVDCTKSAEEIMDEYKAGKIFYIGDIPYSVRGNEDYADLLDTATVRDSLSTLVFYLNQNALIDDGAEGAALFKDKNVRKALSLAIDREKIASMLVYAEAATGLVPNGVISSYQKKKSESFRTDDNALLSASADMKAAKALLKDITPSDYSFSITVAKYDKKNVAVANEIKKAWGSDGLGFNVTVKEVTTIQNNDILKLIGAASEDVCDDQFTEALQMADYEVILADSVSYSADAFATLACYAKPFSGMPVDMDSTDYALVPHRTGYDSADYNNLIEAIYYIPYFEEMDRDGSSFSELYHAKGEYEALYDAIEEIYDTHGIETTTDSKKWAAQKAELLEAAEELLLEDMPVIPVVFNKDAILVSEELTDVDSTFYIPASFTKTDLKDYQKYSYKDGNDNSISIFASFPEILWDKVEE